MKNIYIAICLVIVAFLSHQTSNAQQDPNFSLYNYNMTLLNPAYAGSQESDGFTMAYRKQWIGFPGAPKSISGTYSWSTRKKLGIAINVFSNKYIVSNRVNVSADVSYNVQLADETKLYFGLKLGGGFYNVDLANVVTPFPDPNFSENINAFNTHLGFGMYLVDTNYYISVSTPNFIREKIGTNSTTEKTNFYVGGGYHFKINDNFTLTPRAMMHLLGTFENSYDVGASLTIKEKFTLGTNYRIDEMITFYGLFNPFKNVTFGFSYDTITSSFGASNLNGSLDIILKYRL